MLDGSGSLPIVEQADVGLNSRFSSSSEFRPSHDLEYRLLPFRFTRLDSGRYLLSNFSGEHLALPQHVLPSLVRHQLDSTDPLFEELISRHFILDSDSNCSIDLLATQYRTRQQMLAHLTGLFMFVVSLRCDHSCPYCQVSRQSADRHRYDMSREHADAAVEFMFQSPSPQLKVEFQGGEPLLNFEIIQHIVLKTQERNAVENRDVQFVIASNLVFLTDEILEFCAEHEISFSTSLDGPRDLHNANRPRPGSDSYEKTVEGIERIRKRLGEHRVAALMTTTEASLERPIEIVEEYVRLRFPTIFLRPISPYGFAVKTGQAARYNTDRWLDFYCTALYRILELNAEGLEIREEYAALIMRRVLTPFPTGYVDLQSPSGLGIGCIAFNYDGGIYPSDEARMLTEMGDPSFRLGTLGEQSFTDILTHPKLVELLSSTMTEGMPMCSDCGFQPYCGTDPLHHYVTQGDLIGYKPTSDFCHRNMEVMRHLLCLYEDNPTASRILTSWAM